MTNIRWWIAILATVALGVATAPAQTGGGAAAPTGGGATANGAAGPATAAAAEAKPGFFKRCCQALDDCKRKLCKTAAGQLLNSMTAPVSTLTGGVIPSFCPIMPNAADLAKPGVDGAAANAKKDALEAKERVKAVRYLGTLDCRYYPEAEMALIAALRTDRVECVRWEAALAFGRGCCCTRKVIEALEISVSGSERDGNPSERSERVREAAFFALNHCLACFRETPIEVDEKDNKEKPPIEKKKGGELPAPKVTRTDREILDKARRTVAMYAAQRETAKHAPASAPQTVLPQGQRDLYHIIKFGAEGTGQPATQPAPQLITFQVPQSAPAVAPQQLPAPRETTRGQSVPPAQPMPRVQNAPAAIPNHLQNAPAAIPPRDNIPEAVVIPPDNKPLAPAAAVVEPMDPTPAPMVLNLQPEAPARTPQPTTLHLQPPATTLNLQPPQSNLNLQPPQSNSNLQRQPSPLNLQPQQSTPPAAIAKSRSDEETVSNLIDAMLTGSTPNDRHQAIRSIVTQDWRKYPQIIAALVKTARLDSDRAVRVSAIRHLAALKIDAPYVFDHLKYMQKDQDSWVRQESTVALKKLGR